jgi:aminoglycoside phosphotransferase (APT) family kinase protein
MDVDERVAGFASDAVDGCSRDRITAVRRFQSGERHAVHRVSYVEPDGAATDVVVRVSLSNDADEVARAEHEAAVLQKVQGVAAPRLHAFRARSPWFDAPAMCVEHVDGQQRDLGAASTEDLERLGAVVGRLHRLPVDDAESAAAYRDGRLAQVASYMPSVRDPLPTSVQRRLRQALETLVGAPPAVVDMPLVLLHGDISGGNVIWGPEPVLIDWEYARLGDAADEIAYTFSQNGLSVAQRDAFWNGYGATTGIVERVASWEPVTLLGSALWWIERWSVRADADAAGTTDPSAPKPQQHYLDNALQRLDRFEALRYL